MSLPLPAEWKRPPWREGRKSCGRDPEAGPGTCKLWWEGCPKGEKRGCYLFWLKQQAEDSARAE